MTDSADQTARLWNVQTGQRVRNFVGFVLPVLYIGFADNGRAVITGDTQNAYRWRASLDDVIAFTCAQLTRELTDDGRALYCIADKHATCAKGQAPKCFRTVTRVESRCAWKTLGVLDMDDECETSVSATGPIW